MGVVNPLILVRQPKRLGFDNMTPLFQALNETWDTFVVILILTSRVGTKPMAVSFTSIELRKVRLNVRGASYMKEVILFFAGGGLPKVAAGQPGGKKGGLGWIGQASSESGVSAPAHPFPKIS